MTSQTIVKMEGISKAFAGIKALDNVQIDLRQGEIHALMGENGAGKSTLMKISLEYIPEIVARCISRINLQINWKK